ncbi:MAG TPA: MarR family transcriptional regulator [Edaphobacter sp.]|jgi:DNA-binding MarR family transcriptional regulator|nr:MarR family transcriptional regulator [Edaphobacter sp.]
MATNGKKSRQEETRLAAQLMKRILIHFRGQLDEALRPQRVTTAQLQVLYAIRNEPGASGAQLARLCYITPQSAQSLLKSLEEGGWIVRVKDKVNDRILVAQLTPSGEELLETAEKAARVIEKRVWKGVSDEGVERLNAVLEQCLGNLESES